MEKNALSVYIHTVLVPTLWEIEQIEKIGYLQRRKLNIVNISDPIF